MLYIYCRTSLIMILIYNVIRDLNVFLNSQFILLNPQFYL